MERRPLWQRQRGLAHEQHSPLPPGMASEEGASSLSRSKTFSGPTRHSATFAALQQDDNASSSAAGVRRHQSLSLRRGPMVVPASASSSSSSSHPASPTSPTQSTWTPTPEEARQLSGGGFASSSGVATADVEAAFQQLALDEAAAAGKKSPPNLFPLITSFGEAPPSRGASSAAAYVKPIGHSSKQPNPEDAFAPLHDRGAATAAVGSQAERWLQQKASVTGHTAAAPPPSARSPPGFEHDPPYHHAPSPHAALSPVAFQPFDPLPPGPGLGLGPGFAARPPLPFYRQPDVPPDPAQLWRPDAGLPGRAPLLNSQAGILAMASQRGYNPMNFDCRPRNAHFCVIKSYTEEDIHKSIKYEIWSSTVLGNKRLDRVFREGASVGPIYLFFSVNGSGHFCGVAEMLSPVDETVDSTVWADNKWKGIFKLRWIYVKDVPNSALRHLRLSNTAENKPVTSSRDTQEVPYDIGVQMLGIIKAFPSKTTLLEDLLFYEAQEQSKQLAASLAARQQQQQQLQPDFITPSQVLV